MELQQLAYLVAIADDHSFTRAAARLGVAQPGVSAQIRRLERELGEELFDRSERQIRLTAAGEALLPFARAALDAVERGRQAIAALRGLASGQVTVGMVPSASFHDVDLPGLLADFRTAHPGVAISLVEARADRLLELIGAREIDLAFTAIAGVLPDEFDGIVLNDDRLGAAVGRNHAWARKPSITLEELHHEALICLPVGAGMRTLLDEACSVAGFTAQVALEASDPSVVAQLAAAGLGIAVLPESIIRAFPRALHGIELTGIELRGQVVLAWRAGGVHSPAARELISLAQARFGNDRFPDAATRG
jgi:DNA-binding transcriptional LysR family regulator